MKMKGTSLRTGGPARPWAIELLPWPYGWSQLADFTVDGSPDENRLNNCGPESVAEVVRHLTGVQLPADYVHDRLKGEGYTGYFQIGDLARFLARDAGVPVEVLEVGSEQALLWQEWRHLVKGWPLIGLFSFTAPGANDGHFRPVTGMDAHWVVTSDPWTGHRRVEGRGAHWAWSKGVVLGVQRARDPQL